MEEKLMSHEEIDALMQKVDLAAYKSGGRLHVSADAVRSNPAAALPSLCPIYKAVRPILVVISQFPLLPQKWRDVIKTLIGILDTLCP